MTHFTTLATGLGLVLLLGPAASAQSGKQDEKPAAQKSEGQKSDSQANQKSESQKQDSQHQGSGRVETIRGELASVSVLGETMVDYSSGRGVVAQLTYLTILGSPSGGQGGKVDSGAESTKSANQGSKGAGSEKKEQGQSGQASRMRRTVYEVAITPDTQVRDRGMEGSQASSDKQGGSARERSQAALEHLQLGDRVEVEFDRFKDQARAGSGGEGQGGSASQSRHGRHRIVRGMAKTLTILHDADGDHQHGSGEHKGGDSSDKEKSKSDSPQKKSDSNQ